MSKEKRASLEAATVVEPDVRRDKNGTVLIPTPSENVDDPLNWSLSRKLRLLFIVCLSAYAGNVGALAGQLAYPRQAKVYNVSTIESSYSVSAALAGLAAGALFFCPFALVIGRSAVTFWSLVGSLACAVWSARMTHEDDYVKFIISRMLSGMFGSVPSALGGGTIMDIFFLHQRGKAFMVFSLCLQLGAVSGPTFGAFIVEYQSWTVCFWWTVALLGVTAILVLLFSEETNFNRKLRKPPVATPKSFLSNRIATFCPGTAITPRCNLNGFIRAVATPFLIGLSPAVVVIGIYSMLLFGWALLIDTLTPLFLQTPVAEGGYGFSPIQNGGFSFCQWFGQFTAQAMGALVNDAIPLWICNRFYNSTWRPELRLHVMWLPLTILPIGLGLCGAALQYHLHYMVYALGVFFAAIAALLATPVATNYAAESFTHHGEACALIITFYRLAWGEAIPFFADQWIDRVGVGWVFGMSAFFTVASAVLILLLLWRGHTLREWSLVRSLATSEEGEKIQ